ncbi:MAG: IclR family transcriptional regulator [Candidatus Competibacteraceae bacterium]|nr:IclR family transcriptional regulator [Candidatus Competibacteraceae bacterium]
MADDGGVAAVDRALTLLEAFKEEDQSLTLTELSKRVGFYKSTTLRLTESLEKFGYLRRLGDGAFRLGPKPLFLGYLYQKHFETGNFVPPVLQKIVDELQESASFFIRDDDKRVCLHRIDTPRTIRDSIHEGTRFPLTVGASGHVILAFNGLSGLKYDQIREQLFAVSMGERDKETAAVACPVFSVGQKFIGAISLSGPKYRFEKANTKKMVEVLQKYSKELTESFGGRWPLSK